MLSFYKDANLTDPVSSAQPLYSFLPQTGAKKEGSLYLGLDGIAVVQAVSSGASYLQITSTLGLPFSGTAYVAGNWFTYTSAVNGTLAGIPLTGTGSLQFPVPQNSRLYPFLTITGQSLEIDMVSDDLMGQDGLQMRLRRPDYSDQALTFSGASLVLPYTNLNPHRGLVLGYRFAETGGATAYDYSIQRLHAAIRGPASFRTDGVQPGSGAYNLNGSSVYLSTGITGASGTALDVAGSLELWFQPAQASTLITLGTSFTLSVNAQNQISFLTTGHASPQVSTAVVNLNQWNYLVLTWTSGQTSLYVNGAIAGITYASVSQPFDSQAITINPGLTPLLVDEFRLNNRVLDSSEILTRYAGGSGAGLLDYGIPIIQIVYQAAVLAGAARTYSSTVLNSNGYKIVETGVSGYAAYANFVITRIDLNLHNRFRLYPATRNLNLEMPGFVYGQYRWRDENSVNGYPLVPTQWDIDPLVIGSQKFIPGIGDGEDLAVAAIEKSADQINSIFARITAGFYFTGPEGYYLPANPVLDIFPAASGEQAVTLSQTPKSQTPVYAGTYNRDFQGFYDAGIRYRNIGKQFSATDQFDPSDLGYQFALNRAQKTIATNQGFSASPLYLGVATQNLNVIDIPLFPIGGVTSVYFDNPRQFVALVPSVAGQTGPCYTYNADQNLIQIQCPDSYLGQALFLTYLPALAVFYDAVQPASTSTLDQTSYQLTTADLNPAFSGLSSGYLYLMHKNLRSDTLILSADKPTIDIPPQFQNYEGIVAFGPVYYDNDFALLICSALGLAAGDVISRANLQVVVQPGWQGLLNYQDPLAGPINITTGGDGNASLIFTPPSVYGNYLSLQVSLGTSGTGSSLLLPQPLDFDQLWNSHEGWLVKTYKVLDDNPQLGIVNANPVLGEIPFVASGTPGTVSYQTNGQRVLLQNGSNALLPLNALDASVNPALILGALNPAFNGQAVSLQYAQVLPTDANIGAFFVSYIGRSVLQLFDATTGVYSNFIILQMDVPPVVTDASPLSSYLVLNDQINGRLSSNRLGGAPILPPIYYSARY